MPRKEKLQPTPDFPEETQHLQEISLLLSAALQDAQQSVGQIDQEYAQTKQYMVRNRSDIDPRELFQGEQALRQMNYTGAFAVAQRDRILRLQDSPYFARIDFREQGSRRDVPFYIGPFSFRYEKALYIVDWRAPVASMFYDYETGPASYLAPQGAILGELTRKRQFKIKNGQMEYAFENEINIQDEVLQRELSQTSDQKMKSIIF